MIFRPQNLILNEGEYLIPQHATATAHPCLNTGVIREFWNGFTHHVSTLQISEGTDFVFSIGNAKKLPLDGYDYSISIEREGICLCAKDEKTLLSGFMTLLDRIQAVDLDGQLAAGAECCQIKDKPLVGVRMVHFCIFHNTELWELERFVRVCGALKYTHIILEFWGTLQYDCLKELSWPGTFTKEQIRPIIQTARDLGLEVIPMFNHWGHATGAGVTQGAHVVLDQNPALQLYFSEDGWCWDIRKPRVRALLRSIRRELIELCGNGDYFHIGCDEAYNFVLTEESATEICDMINEMAEELRQEGRRTIVWGDMFLYRHKHYVNPRNYACHAPSPEIEKTMLARLDKRLVIADWQYEIEQAPIDSAAVVKNAGFDCLLCSWDRGLPQMKAVLSTTKDLPLMGFMHTTWGSQATGYHFVLLAAVGGFGSIDHYKQSGAQVHTAALLRKVMPTKGIYEKAGWRRF